jgi:hypothetical protein
VKFTIIGIDDRSVGGWWHDQNFREVPPMSHNDDSRLLLVGSIMSAFVLGAIFGALGAALRPRKVLAPAAPIPSPPPQPVVTEPEPNLPAATAEGEDLTDSVLGNGTHDAPSGFPIKGNQRSGIYHVPGGFAYDRTVADIFFRTPEAAEAAGLRHSKA